MAYGRIYWAGKFEGAQEPEVPHVTEENPNFRFNKALVDDMTWRIKANSITLGDGRTIIELPEFVQPGAVANIVGHIYYVRDIYKVLFVILPFDDAVRECLNISRKRGEAFIENKLSTLGAIK